MTSSETPDELSTLYSVLMPVLSKVAIGDFDSEIELSPIYSGRVNELLAGVQVLLEVAREKIVELEALNAALEASRDRSVSVLDEVLRKSLER